MKAKYYDVFDSPHEYTMSMSRRFAASDSLLDTQYQHKNLVLSVINKCTMVDRLLYIPIKVHNRGLKGKVIEQFIGPRQGFILIQLYSVLGLCDVIGDTWRSCIVKPGVTWEHLNFCEDKKFCADWMFHNKGKSNKGRCFMNNIRPHKKGKKF